jgi:hypothetical protein
MKKITRKIKVNSKRSTSSFRSGSGAKDYFLHKIGILLLVAIVAGLVILFFPPAQNLIINLVALMLNTLVLSNIFLCNIIVIVVLGIALVIDLYIFKKIR